MRRAILLALLGVFLLATPSPAQSYTGNPVGLVRYWYKRFLERPPDPGMNTWVNALANGGAPESVLSGILGSPEYWQKCGSTPTGFVTELFSELVGRRPTPGETNYWVSQMTYQDSRDIAYAMLMRYPQSWRVDPNPYDNDDNRHDYRRRHYRWWR